MRKENFEGILSGLREALAHAKGEANDLTIHELPDLDVASVRAKTKLSQGEFARAFGVALGTLQGWEQKRRRPGDLRVRFSRSSITTLLGGQHGPMRKRGPISPSTRRARRRPRARPRLGGGHRVAGVAHQALEAAAVLAEKAGDVDLSRPHRHAVDEEGRLLGRGGATAAAAALPADASAATAEVSDATRTRGLSSMVKRT